VNKLSQSQIQLNQQVAQQATQIFLANDDCTGMLTEEYKHVNNNSAQETSAYSKRTIESAVEERIARILRASEGID